MSDAKKCDICGGYYESGVKQNHLVYEKGSNGVFRDECPECAAKIDRFIDSLKKGKSTKKKAKKKPHMSKEKKEAQSKRMQRVQQEALKIREEFPGTPHKKAIRLASQRLKGAAIQDIPESEQGSKYKRKYKCVMCQENTVSGSNEMCQECEDKFHAEK